MEGIQLEQLQEKLKMPEGTFSFLYSSKSLLNCNINGGKIFEIVSGAHIFILERDDDCLLKFYYSSTSTGTKIATLNLKSIPKCDKFIITLTWSPKDISLHLGAMVAEEAFFSAKGEKSNFQLLVGKDNAIYQIGDSGIEIMDHAIFQNGQKIVAPSAVELWRSTKKALKILKSGKSKDGYVYEMIVANFSISILVTGFETYIKKRIVELEKEGVSFDVDNFLKSILSKYQKEEGFVEKYKKIAKNEKLSLLEYIVKERVVNFQNYKTCKLAFNKLFGIKFGDLGLDEKDIIKLKELINFRHRVIHDSVFNGIVNQANVPPEEPIFSNSKLSERAIKVFDLFINKLHEATLQKR